MRKSKFSETQIVGILKRRRGRRGRQRPPAGARHQPSHLRQVAQQIRWGIVEEVGPRAASPPLVVFSRCQVQARFTSSVMIMSSIVSPSIRKRSTSVPTSENPRLR